MSSIHPVPWDDVLVPHGVALPGSATADVCVIGAGITGLSIAYQLARDGLDVAVVERGRIAGGETHLTSAHLSTALDDRYFRLEELHGSDGARAAALSHRAAIDWIESFVAREAVPCDFQRVPGYLIAGGSDGPAVLEREHEAARRAGVEDCELVGGFVLGREHGLALRFAGQAQLHPLAYLVGLVQAFQRLGGRVHEDAAAVGLEHDPVVVKLSRGRQISCGAAVVATNAPISSRVALHTKLAAYRTYAVGLALPHGAFPDVLLWDTADPYHYVRVARGPLEDVLIVGGEDHRTGHADDGQRRWNALEAWARARFPDAGPRRHAWSGQILETLDGLAYIGVAPGGDERVYVATGDSGHGLTHGTIAAMLIGAALTGRDSPWKPLYDPARLRVRALGTYARENASTLRHYADWLQGSEVHARAEVPPGAGRILRESLRPVAVYRDEDGVEHACSAVCPHLGGVVSWNSAEKSWDCPLHGSRFDAEGRVIAGPANRDLTPLSAPASEAAPAPVESETTAPMEAVPGPARVHEPQ